MSTPKYHKTATKDVRPFFEVATLEESLKSAQIRLYEDQPFTDVASFTIESQDATRLAIVVRPGITEATLASAGIARSKLVVAVTAVNPFLKRTELVHRMLLKDDVPGDVAIGSEVLERLGGGSNMTIEVVLCLATDLKKEAGKPFMQGHWLSKKSFELRPPKPTEDFDVEPMGDEGWKAMGFPPKTLYHVDYYTGFNEPVDKSRPIAKVRIHEDVHKKLAVENLPAMSRPIMAFLAAEIPCQLLAASLTEWKDAAAPEPRSPLDAFFKRLKRIEPQLTMTDLTNWAGEPGMPRIRALLHSDQESVRKVVEA
ncbi:hypothetical protein FNZ56_07805 [Pseudoluteimonas lycopersici]|uniref:Uncharacterized protein n=1 Tax=Pseudoluteimonas lycopersici TaxID=1324796 RepID=A0A516V5H9_9GAMM|nr:hypothetical protein [Lysobacter lycopersici]QDQ73783.1 hypothetical protein FNZ56_07805 [Lysobacter lycopersici]